MPAQFLYGGVKGLHLGFGQTGGLDDAGADIRKALLERPHRARNEPLGMPRRRGIQRLVLDGDHGEQRDGRHAQLEAALRVSNLPATAFFSADGTLQSVHTGAYTADGLRDAIRSNLGVDTHA
mgnify:CR=1 FL=1